MVILIAGASHTGKTALAQKLLDKYGYPYLSIDLLKMGLIRSGNTELTPEDDDKLTEYLWPIVSEIIKTAIENSQNLIVEGVYIPFDWKMSFEEKHLKEIKYRCLIMTEDYIKEHFSDIKKYADITEKRLYDDWYTAEMLAEENKRSLEECLKFGLDYILISGKYDIEYIIANTSEK